MSPALRSGAEVLLGRMRSPDNAAGEHTTPYLRAANVGDGELLLDDVKSMNFSPAEQRRYALEPGDVLVTEGSGSRSTVGATAAWPGSPEPMMFQNTLLRLRALPHVEPRFLYWWSRHAYISGLYAEASQGLAIWHLSAERVRTLPFDVADRAQQRRIADFLDDHVMRLDKATVLRQRQSELILEAALAHLTNRYVQDFGAMRLGLLLRGLEQGWSPQCEDRLAAADEFGVLKAGCVNGGVFRPAEHKALPPSVSPRLDYLVRPGDLLMSRASGSLDLIGSAAVVPPDTPGNLLLCDKVYRLSLDRELDPVYVALMLRSRPVREAIKLGASGAEGMANNLPSSTVRGLLIPRSPTDHQRASVAEILAMNGQLNRCHDALMRSLSLLAERRQALITAAVTGQFDVTTARAVA